MISARRLRSKYLYSLRFAVVALGDAVKIVGGDLRSELLSFTWRKEKPCWAVAMRPAAFVREDGIPVMPLTESPASECNHHA
jgi:hypothetical protein